MLPSLESHLFCEFLRDEDNNKAYQQRAATDEQEVQALAAFLIEIRSKIR